MNPHRSHRRRLVRARGLNHAMKDDLHFHWKLSDIDDQFIHTVGRIVIAWMPLDEAITEMCRAFVNTALPEKLMPKSFDGRVKFLGHYAKIMYANEPDEWRIFAWFLQRLKSSNGHRDAVVHGRFGMITKNGRSYEGLLVPNPTSPTATIPMTKANLLSLASELEALAREGLDVRFALTMAQSAYGSAIHHSMESGVWTRLTVENRKPRMPRSNVPPAGFKC